MSRMIIKQKDGKYSIWSSVVDDFIYTDCTKEEWIEIRKEETCKQVENDLNIIFEDFENGKIPRWYPTKKYNSIKTAYNTDYMKEKNDESWKGSVSGGGPWNKVFTCHKSHSQRNADHSGPAYHSVYCGRDSCIRHKRGGSGNCLRKISH